MRVSGEHCRTGVGGALHFDLDIFHDPSEFCKSASSRRSVSVAGIDFQAVPVPVVFYLADRIEPAQWRPGTNASVAYGGSVKFDIILCSDPVVVIVCLADYSSA